MYKKQKILAVITARGGSKGLPGKNVKDFCGKPLIAWTIEAAKNSQWIDKLILSSEDANIIAVAKEWGCEVPFVRPAELATDEAQASDVLLHAITELPDFDWLVLLQPTSPLRHQQDIDQCIVKAIDNNVPCATVSEATKNPCQTFAVDREQYRPLLGWDYFRKRRQDLPTYLVPNGGAYCISYGDFLLYKSFYREGMSLHVMPQERSVDIDSPMDWQMAEWLYHHHR